jgi:site-specific recombinase XerD
LRRGKEGEDGPRLSGQGHDSWGPDGRLSRHPGAVRAKAPLRTQLEQYARDFARALAQQYASTTVRKHTTILALFIEFVSWQTDVQRIEEMTRGIANSAFRQWHLSKVGDRTESELKTTVRKFFEFLAQAKGIRNEAVLQSFRR